MNIIFFSSGDFAIETLKKITEDYSKKYGLEVNVKGIVTSNGKGKYSKETIKDIAIAQNIPYCIPKNEDELFDFIKGFIGIDLYVVISYKKLSERILKLVYSRAINIHASVLPFLKGAAPINWAIRNGFKETGLTAFYLNNEIDCGDIIHSIKTNISDTETFKSLYLKLSELCSTFLIGIMYFISEGQCYAQKQIKLGIEDKYKELFKAPKITSKYWGDWLCLSQKEIDCLFRSTDEGLPVKLYAVNRDDNRDFYEFDAKIWDFDFIPNFEEGSDGVNWDLTECDGKNYIRVVFGNQVEKVISIKEIQLSGKKRLGIKEFLRGFKYSRLIEQYQMIISTAEYGV